MPKYTIQNSINVRLQTKRLGKKQIVTQGKFEMTSLNSRNEQWWKRTGASKIIPVMQNINIDKFTCTSNRELYEASQSPLGEKITSKSNHFESVGEYHETFTFQQNQLHRTSSEITNENVPKPLRLRNK